MNERNWIAYYHRLMKKNTPPRELLLKAITNFDKGVINKPKFAIDLGCGAGCDTIELLRCGWSVLAIDSQPTAIANLLSVVQGASSVNQLQTKLASFETLNSLPNANLIHASFSLPFLRPVYFYKFWKIILETLDSGDRFSGSFFGLHDSWRVRPDMTFLNREMVCNLFAQFKMEFFEEEEKDDVDALGYYKHWHKFFIVAKKIT